MKKTQQTPGYFFMSPFYQPNIIVKITPQDTLESTLSTVAIDNHNIYQIIPSPKMYFDFTSQTCVKNIKQENYKIYSLLNLKEEISWFKPKLLKINDNVMLYIPYCEPFYF